jgi:hypothetical protein
MTIAAMFWLAPTMVEHSVPLQLMVVAKSLA